MQVSSTLLNALAAAALAKSYLRYRPVALGYKQLLGEPANHCSFHFWVVGQA
jgi:hypothetical protein